MWRWSKAAMSLRLSDCNMPLPNTSPDITPMPTTVTGAPCGFPRPPRGDAHLLMVVTMLPTRRKRIAQPEIAPLRDLVGEIGITRRTFVRRDHQVWTIAVVTLHPCGPYGLLVNHIIGEV